ncbi:unnamed protein product [Nippostrongylus brasiliensis]|uniref:Soluble calcium-activated nucleotidase 1 (inferred by orthology to a human protein) n=1 Tax=Nippostrongylus brasiliensis TaxID=27835 RepID=A0A0N4YWR1_NIPBR|nr:unnamed protein product [Nippostrongylus brasiliensis]
MAQLIFIKGKVYLLEKFIQSAKSLSRARTVTKHPDGSTEYKVLIVTDLDRGSATGDNKTWRALTRQGKLIISKNRKQANITWDLNADKNLTGKLNINARAMELSELSVFHNRILTPDDRTGMIYEIKDNEAIPWVFLNSGPGNTTEGFKAEWMTIKDDLLYVGSHGNEFRNASGAVLHENNMWVKTVSPDGAVTHHDWRTIFDKIRNACGIYKPGYLTHEAAQYSETRRMWFFLPRKASNTTYDETADETKGTNYLIMGKGDLSAFYAKRVGTLTDTQRRFVEFRDTNGNIVHENNMWVKTVSPDGAVTHHDWRTIFDKIRNACGIYKPGYLTHEAAQYSETRRMWFFLPRKASNTTYEETADEKKGTNYLIMGKGDLSAFYAKRVGTLTDTTRGFSAFDFVPETRDFLIAALKSREVTGSDDETYFTVFDVNGLVILDDQKIDGNYKFEGLFFI